jgi:hypothetical protein
MKTSELFEFVCEKVKQAYTLAGVDTSVATEKFSKAEDGG